MPTKKKDKPTKAQIEALQKAAQRHLQEASEALDRAAECAEEGGFNISFNGGGTYVPSAAFDVSSEEVRDRAIEQIKRYYQDFDSWDKDKQEEYIDDYSRDILYDLRRYEYADGPGWWMPSRNC